MLFRRVCVLVDVTETNIRIPKQAQSETSSSTHHTVILVLVDPAVTLLGLHHQLVIAESRINKGVDKGTSQVPTCRVNIRGCCSYEHVNVNLTNVENESTYECSRDAIYTRLPNSLPLTRQALSRKRGSLC